MLLSGGPAAPVTVLRVVNSTLLVLEWEEPFTWPYTSIQHYSISVNTSMEGWNHTRFTGNSLEFRASGQFAECAVLSFVVWANNGLADGILTTVSGGFPIGMSIAVLILHRGCK